MSHRRVELAGGSVQAEVGAGVVIARGLPYGRAERFQPPQPAPAWTGVHDGTRRGPACPQLPSRLEWMIGSAVDGLTLSEQCLVLSVTAPDDADSLPVMIWFHGGAYVTGGGESSLYDASSLVREGAVVVVTVTYRLGVLGYLTPESVGGVQNLGLRDQILAVQWVADNIAAFGGDPTRITVFGQSAGADAVVSLLLCDQARGLISRAIVQSAPLGLLDGREPMTAAMLRAVDESLDGLDPGTASLDRLMEAQIAATVVAQSFPNGWLAFGPIVGHDPLPAPDVVAQRLSTAASDVEIVIGYALHDAAPFVALSQPDRVVDPDSAEVAARTDAVFGRPARDLAQTWRTNGGRVASYRMDWIPEGAPLGACHCIELPLLFGETSTWARAAMLGSRPSPIDEDLAAEVRSRWTSFAHDGVAAWGETSVQFG